jgi:outer membrane protein TolC
MRDRASNTDSALRRATVALLAVLTATAVGPGAMAQTSVRTTTVGAGDTAPPPVVQEGALQLSLEDAVEIALRRNLDLALQRYDRTQSLLRIDQAQGIFDFNVGANYSQSNVSSPTSSDLSGALVLETEDRTLGVTGTQLTPDGGQLRFDLQGNRSTTNNTFVFLNPDYFAVAGVGFTQPLLRGFGRTVTKRSILQARLASDINRETFEQQVAQTIEDVERAYWGLVESREQLNVSEESLDLARELDERNRIQVDVGTLAPIELVQSEATVATRQEEIIRSQASVGDAEDRLRQLLNLDRGAFWDLPIVPVTDPETEHLQIDLDQAIATALAERPELRSQQLDVQIAEVDREFFDNARMPRLDLGLIYSARGRAGRGMTVDPDTGDVTTADGDITDAFSDALGRDFDAWQVDLTFAYPIQNREARAQSAIADLEVDRSRTQLDQLQLAVVTEVRAAARAVNTAAEQITSASASRRLQERNLDAEQKRYQNGMSTSFQVTEIQEDVTAARSREVSAVTNYRVALVSYYRAIGRLLEENGVELLDADDVAPGDVTAGGVAAPVAETATAPMEEGTTDG